MLDKLGKCLFLWVSVDLHAKMVISAVFTFIYFHFDRDCVRMAKENPCRQAE